MVGRNSKADYLGTGWSFPPRFDRESGAAMVSGADDVEESLRILISTRLGERVMLPLYGTPLDPFQSMSFTNLNNVKSQVREALIRFEPRVEVVSVDIEAREGGLDGEMRIMVTYDIPSVNNRANMVIPFYLKEGNLVRLPPDAVADGDGG